MKTTAFLLLSLLSLLQVSVSAQSNLVLLRSGGDGQIDLTTNLDDVTIQGTPVDLRFTAFGLDINFSGPDGAPLDTGAYVNAARWPFNGPQPGLDVSGNGHACSSVCGQFQIFELHTNSDGAVDRFWGTFAHHCECFSSTLIGEIRYNSQLAPLEPIPRIWRVPADFSTIQAALGAASLLATDTVLVDPGIYNEPINFLGKSVHVVSTRGPEETFITSQSRFGGISFCSRETRDAVLCGFSITNCNIGIDIQDSSPTIVSNIIKNCGDGISGWYASPYILSNHIISCRTNGIFMSEDVSFVGTPFVGTNKAQIVGNVIRTNDTGIRNSSIGGIFAKNNIIQGSASKGLFLSDGTDYDLYQNLIVENGGAGIFDSGIFCSIPNWNHGTRIINNTICDNSVAGIYTSEINPDLLVVNNIIVGDPAIKVENQTYYYDFRNIRSNDIFSRTGNIFSGGGAQPDFSSNILANPAFACGYHLLAGSPCIDNGDNSYVTNSLAVDLEGRPRVIGPVVDLGAFEADPSLPYPACDVFIYCPSNIVVRGTPDGGPVSVEYSVPGASPGATITSVPPSGTLFQPGTNMVYCSATLGTNTATCTFMVTVLVHHGTKPPNDEMENATVIPSLPFEEVIDMSAATRSNSDGYCSTIGNTVWYEVPSKKNQEITLSSEGSDFEADFMVLTKNHKKLVPVACGLFAVAFKAQAGRTYYLMVTAPFDQGDRLHLTAAAHPILPPLKVYATVSHTAVLSGGKIHYRGTITASRPTNVLVYASVWVPGPGGRTGIDYIFFRMECNGKFQTWDYTGAMPVTVTRGSVEVVLNCFTDDESESQLMRSDNTVLLLPQFFPR